VHGVNTPQNNELGGVTTVLVFICDSDRQAIHTGSPFVNSSQNIGSQVLTAVVMVYGGDIKSCSALIVYRRFGGICRLQRVEFFITAVRISNPKYSD
jgi:hypothetical protein